ncbi:MAG: nucleoside triphosphate pyrophosphatase [Pseudorhodoplanes sp.]
MPLWLSPDPLVLASRSAVRREILQAAGIAVEIVPADIDERAVERQAGTDEPAVAARLLAREKARAVAAAHPGRIVLGADQTLSLGNRRLSKPADRAGARAQLLELRARTHELHSAAALVRDGTLHAELHDVAALTMRNFSDAFLEAYLDAAGASVTQSVGGYQLEKTGIQLFARIEGSHFTILGLPLFALLQSLRDLRLVSA